MNGWVNINKTDRHCSQSSSTVIKILNIKALSTAFDKMALKICKVTSAENALYLLLILTLYCDMPLENVHLV